MKSVFDWTKEITGKKSPSSSFTDKDWDVWNSYMVHKVLSMNPDNIGIVNEVQEIQPQNKKAIYQIYQQFIPSNKRFYKYVKSTTKQPNKELVEYLKQYFKVSSREIKDYLEILDKPKLVSILTEMGVDPKEIKKITK